MVWGEGKNGQLGLGRLDKHKNPLVLVEHPTPLVGLFNKEVRSLAAGSNHVLALTKHGTVYTWGMGKDGRLGHDDYDDRWEPTLVERLSGKEGRARNVVVCVGAGHAHSLASFEEGRRVCTWGRGAHGRLGTGRHLNQKVSCSMVYIMLVCVVSICLLVLNFLLFQAAPSPINTYSHTHTHTLPFLFYFLFAIGSAPPK